MKSLDSLIKEITVDFSETADSTGISRMSPEVEQALRRVPREQFVSKAERHLAYGNFPLPIGCGQTISQPFIVALMTELLQLDSNCKVLEVGTGCGYQTAVLAEIVKEVYTIEIHAELGEAAFERLKKLGYTNIHYRSGDGSLGWQVAAPFDGIIVTACADQLPHILVDQLAVGGLMAIPLEQELGRQELTVVTKNADGDIEQRNVLGVRFVPVTH